MTGPITTSPLLGMRSAYEGYKAKPATRNQWTKTACLKRSVNDVYIQLRPLITAIMSPGRARRLKRGAGLW